jgi:hypothetical protein
MGSGAPASASSDAYTLYLFLKQQRLAKAIQRSYKPKLPNNFTKHNDRQDRKFLAPPHQGGKKANKLTVCKLGVQILPAYP